MKFTFLFYFGLLFIIEAKCFAKTLEVTTDAVTESIVSEKQMDSDRKNSYKTVIQQTTVSDGIKNITGMRTFSDSNPTPNVAYSTEIGPDIPTEEYNIPGVQLKKNSTRMKSNENKYDAKRVYLEDVLFALKNQNWTKDEIPCLNDTIHILRSLQNFTLWAVWDWDSISSQPQGLLFGNRYELGNFDECMNSPWVETHSELKTQYCLAEINLERTDKPIIHRGEKLVQPYESAVDYIMRDKSSIHRPLNELTWGGCVPVSCGSAAVERLMATLLARSHLGAAGLRARINVTESCQRPDRPREFDALFYGFLVLVAILILLAMTCTYLNLKRDSEPKTFQDEIIDAFCLKTNAENLLEMKKEGVEVIYGIRLLTIVFIVMDHQVGIYNSGPIINGLQVDQAAISVAGMFILHDDLFVDTFFVLSGFLVAFNFMKIKNKPLFNPLLLIVRRYLRLVVAFAVVIFFYVAVYPYIGSGPLWNRSIAGETEPCRKNWWLSLLMLGNYVDNENICIVISWYIPCDFHYFIMAVLMFWLYKHQPRLGLVIAIMVTIASILAPGVINYVNQLPAIQLFTYDFVKNPRGSKQFHIAYIKSHVRFTAYIIGLIAGCIFYSCKDTDHKTIPKKFAILGAFVGVFTMTGVMVGGATYLWRDYHPLEGAVYAALNRPIWACGVALVILSCCLGRVPFVEGFLTWYPWVPLSRLSYGLYLTHTALITRNVYATRSPQSNDYVTLLTSSFGVVMIGCMASLVIWLFAEAPVNKIFAVLVKSRVKNHNLPQEKPTSIEESSKNNITPNATVASTSRSGYLTNNLPTNIEISSKM